MSAHVFDPGVRLALQALGQPVDQYSRFALPVAEQRGAIAGLRLTRRTPKTITTKKALSAELEWIFAEGGIAVEDEEFSVGRRALAAVVANTEGWPIAAVELTVPAEVYTRNELLAELGSQVTTTAGLIVSALECAASAMGPGNKAISCKAIKCRAEDLRGTHRRRGSPRSTRLTIPKAPGGRS